MIFILKILYTFNENTSDPTKQYKISLTLRDNRIIQCIIYKGKNTLKFIDSYLILPKKLSHLAEDFNVNNPKSIFFYAFALEHNIFYLGYMPSRQNYKDLSINIMKCIKLIDHLKKKPWNILKMT